MSDDSECDVLDLSLRRKGKRPSAIEDSGSSSDSSFEHHKRRKKVLRLTSNPESDGDDSERPIGKSSRKKVARIMSEQENSSGDSEGSHWDENDSSEEEGVEEEMEEEDCDESEFESEGSESSSCSDWETEEEEVVGEEDEIQNGAASNIGQDTIPDTAAGSSSNAATAAGYFSDSSDGQSEKCPICLLSFSTQEVGTPESCDHSFCVDCIQEWAKNVNTCPVDRQMFSLILVRRSFEGKVIRKIPVELPRRQDEEEVQEDPTYCEVCGECDREDRMLLCDGCDLGYHLECLVPPMDTVPLEEWFCPDCTMSNSVQLAEEVDIQDGELTALLEDASAVGLPPLRPRLSRLLPRTRQSERVRATMIIRQRERNGNQQRDHAQPSTSSGIDSLEADSNASVGSIRRRPQINCSRTIRKRRKITKHKTTRRRKKRRVPSSSTTKKTKLTTTNISKSEVSKKRHKKRRKIKRKKRKPATRRVRRPVRISVPHSVKGRLAEHLGVCPPRRPGQTIPDVRPRLSSSRIDFQRSRAGIPTLHLFGQRDQLDYFSSGSDHEGDVGMDIGGGSMSVMVRPRTSISVPAKFSTIKNRLISTSAIRLATQNIHTASESSSSPQTSCDIIGSILNSQAVWHSKKSVVTINRDGSLNIKSDGGSDTVKKNTEKCGDLDDDVNRTGEGLTVRTDDRLSQISGTDTPLNVSEAGSSTSGHVTQAPMYPGRNGGGSTRPPSGSSFQQFGGSRYSSSPSYHNYQSGRGFSNFPPSSSFDSRGARASYANYLNSGPPPPPPPLPPFRGGSPLRFRMNPRYPIRRPPVPPVRPQLPPQVQQTQPSNIDDFQTDDDVSENQKPPSAKAEDEDEIDIYSDIEVGGGGGGPGGPGSEPDDVDRSMELAYEALPPPPIPPAMLMGMGDDILSDEQGSDSDLVIDDNITPSSPHDESDRYDPEEPTSKPDIPEIPESEKYDPAEPSNDTDEEEEVALKAKDTLSSIAIPTSSDLNITSNCSNVNVHSFSNSNGSTSSSILQSDKISTNSTEGAMSQTMQNVLKDIKTNCSAVNRELQKIDVMSGENSAMEDEETDECPNFSIYSAASMDIARKTGEDEDNEDDEDEDDNDNDKDEDEDEDEHEHNIPESDIVRDTENLLNEDDDKENDSLPEDNNESGIISIGEDLPSQPDESEKQSPPTENEEKEVELAIESEEGELADKKKEDDDDTDHESGSVIVNEKDIGNDNDQGSADIKNHENIAESDAVDGAKKLTLVEEIFGSDDNDSLIGGATSAVSAATVDNAPQASVTPLGLEGLDTETISETEEAINFEDEISQDDGFMTAVEDGEIPSVKRKNKKKNRKLSVGGGSVGEEVASAKDHTPQDIIDYEEGEIVDDRPKQHEAIKKDKKIEKKDKSKYDKDLQKDTDENFDITSKSKSTEDERKKKKKKSSSDKTRTSKDRAVLSSSENKDKSKDKSNKVDDANIAWKKLSKSSKERNYRDPKTKPDADPTKAKEAVKKKETFGKEGAAKKDKKKKEKRKDMERYDVRKIVSDKKRKRRDAFGRDLSRERSYTKSHSRSRGRSYDRSRGRSRSLSRSRINRSKGRSPLKSRLRSRSRSRVRSRSRSRNRSRSRSKTRTKLKTKDRLRRSRSKDKQRSRLSRSRSRRRSRSRTRSRSRNRSRLRSRSRSVVRSRDRRDRSRDRRGSQRCRYRDRRSLSQSWTPSWSNSRSMSCSSYTHSHSPTPRRFNHSYSRSFSRSWSREHHERIPLIEKKAGAISKTAKKLTVIVPNTKDDTERHRKKEKKRKEGKKNKESVTTLEKRKKRKEKSPAPSKEVFTSGDNILVSVNFKSNKSVSKDITNISCPLTIVNKEASKRKQHDGSFEIDRETVKKLRKDKSNKEKISPRLKNGLSGDKAIGRSEKKSKKSAQKAGKVQRVAALVNKKPVAIIDLDQSPFHEQTPSPTDLIVLSDSDDEGINKEGGRNEMSETMNSRRIMRPSSSPKSSSKQGLNTAPSSTIARTPESQSPPMNSVGSYLVTSTGPKTPPEPQIKFSIAAKPQLRSINNPLREEEDMLAEEGGLDDLDQRIEEELDRGLDRTIGEMIHKGPNTPPEPRGPTTPCSPPTSPDAYDPFDPTKSGTPSPVGAGASMNGPPSPAHTPSEQLIQHTVISRESPMVSDLDDHASKSLEARVATPTMVTQEEVADQSSQSPERSKLSVRGETTIVSSPSVIPETTSLPPPVSSDNELSQPSELTEGTEKAKQIPTGLQPPGPTSSITDPNTTQSPERSNSVLTSQPQNLQGTPIKPLFPTTAVKQVPPQQPMTSTPAHSTAPVPVFPTLTPANIASILCTPPPSTMPLSRLGLFNPPTLAVPQLMTHPQQQQQQTPQQHHLVSSPIVPQRPPPTIARTTPEKLATPSNKLPLVRSNAIQNGEQNQSSQKQQDTSTDVVDMDLESPYSPGSSEGDDLFEPPTDIKSSGASASFGVLNERNRTLPQPAKSSNKLPPPLITMPHKSPSKLPGNQDKFDSLFGLSPLRLNKTAPARTTGRTGSKSHHSKAGKMKGKHDKSKGGRKEITIEMDEDQLQILDDVPSSAVELQVKDKFLKKLNRQERVVEEVKLSLKPHYTKKHITKEEYKEILRRSVPKICHNKSGEINPIKIGSLVEAYVKKYRYAAKKKNAAAGKAKVSKTTMWS